MDFEIAHAVSDDIFAFRKKGKSEKEITYFDMVFTYAQLMLKAGQGDGAEVLLMLLEELELALPENGFSIWVTMLRSMMLNSRINLRYSSTLTKGMLFEKIVATGNFPLIAFLVDMGIGEGATLAPKEMYAEIKTPEQYFRCKKRGAEVKRTPMSVLTGTLAKLAGPTQVELRWAKTTKGE